MKAEGQAVAVRELKNDWKKNALGKDDRIWEGFIKNRWWFTSTEVDVSWAMFTTGDHKDMVMPGVGSLLTGGMSYSIDVPDQETNSSEMPVDQ